jgi:hypothetical protein
VDLIIVQLFVNEPRGRSQHATLREERSTYAVLHRRKQLKTTLQDYTPVASGHVCRCWPLDLIHRCPACYQQHPTTPTLTKATSGVPTGVPAIHHGKCITFHSSMVTASTSAGTPVGSQVVTPFALMLFALMACFCPCSHGHSWMEATTRCVQMHESGRIRGDLVVVQNERCDGLCPALKSLWTGLT